MILFGYQHGRLEICLITIHELCGGSGMNFNKEDWAAVISVIDSIAIAPNSDVVFKLCQDYVYAAGGTSLLIGRLVNPIIAGKKISEFGQSDWPEEWANYWVDNDLVIHDPIGQYALRTRSTFEWSEAKKHGTEYGRKILSRGEDFNLKQGIAIPVSTGYLPLGLVSISHQYDNKMPIEILSRLELVAIHAYTRMLHFLEDDNAVPIVALTKREIDILTFTAAGKTSWEISKVYGIAESTVKKHLQNILKKTNAANKTHAVTKALQDGLIIP